MRSKFGWSYPPGVTGNEPELTGEWPPCECCGNNDDDCICPGCAVCGDRGNPNCYNAEGDHGINAMEYSLPQQIGQAKMHVARCKDAVVDAEQGLAYLEEQLEANLLQPIPDKLRAQLLDLQARLHPVTKGMSPNERVTLATKCPLCGQPTNAHHPACDETWTRD